MFPTRCVYILLSNGQHTPISSQVVPLDDLDLSSQCSGVPMTPEKSISTLKSGRERVPG